MGKEISDLQVATIPCAGGGGSCGGCGSWWAGLNPTAYTLRRFGGSCCWWSELVVGAGGRDSELVCRPDPNP